MIALLAAKLTLALFTPLLIGSLLALCIFGLGRMVASRKFTRALDDDDDMPDAAGELPRAIHHNAPLAGFRESSRPVGADIALESVAIDDGVPVAFEFQRTREFLRSQSRKVLAVAETEEETTRFDRAYLVGD
ncbi:hypothetical protein [Enhygromyxa salina]|uniref:Uncharacterized protein n=1 Tax=Enhygromyxa salina TaxID=215803 RepID=A0A2S9YUA2_9BACT|nr:hypothetical protein [Enhygromyxa salina]PRQ08619.1 hypothetical protein ENSA7_16250 [Enhygromyxa salina]